MTRSKEGGACPEGPVLEVRGLVGGYISEVDVLRGIDLVLKSGEIVSIVGPNGAGKSTLAKAIVGILNPREGQVLLREEEITGLAGHEVIGKGLGYVPQSLNVFPSLRVSENLELGALPSPDVSVPDRMQELFRLFPRLAERRAQRAGTLSGGERQMLAMARVLMAGPSVLLLDEPSAGLAPKLVSSIFERITEINQSGVSILIIEQNARMALEVSNRGYVLEFGQNRFEGSGQNLLDDPKVSELYLGEE